MYVVFKESRDRKGEPLWLKAHMSSHLRDCAKSALNCRGRALLCVERLGFLFVLLETKSQGAKAKSLPPWCIPWYRARVPRQSSRQKMASNPGRRIMKSIVFTLAAILACSVGANGYMAYVTTKANYMQEIETKRSRINTDMVNEMMWTRLNTYDQNQMELARMQGYNEGINALVQKVDPQQSQISAIWHAGYQRGLEQSNFMEEMGYEKGYNQGVSKGREEYMKAINNILSGQDDVKTAIREFANVMNKKESESPAPNQKPEGK